jgi:hypothetical protein
MEIPRDPYSMAYLGLIYSMQKNAVENLTLGHL